MWFPLTQARNNFKKILNHDEMRDYLELGDRQYKEMARQLLKGGDPELY